MRSGLVLHPCVFRAAVAAILATNFGIASAHARGTERPDEAGAASLRTLDAAAAREESARAVLTRFAAQLGISDAEEDLVLERVTEDLGGAVVRFAQRHRDVPVFGSGALVGFDGSGAVIHVATELEPDLPHDVIPVVPAAHATWAAGDALAADLSAFAAPRLVFVRGDKQHPGVHLAWEVQALLSDPRGDWLVFVSASTGDVVRKLDQLKRSGPACVACDPTTNPACGRVFFRHPVDAQNNTALSDASNVDASQTGCTLANLTSATNLTGSYVNTTLTSGRISPPYAAFRSANQPAVDEVNVYYHLNRAKTYLTSLGFASVMNFSINVDAHDAALGEDSTYTPSTDALEFGIGGVDNAQDPDILYHEYGHAILDNQVPGFGITEQSGAGGEGFGDYWAAALTDDVAATNLGSACVGGWDATSYNPYNGTLGSGCLRRLDAMKQYPRDFVWEVHDDGEMWSAALWRLRTTLGAALADPIVIQSHTYLFPGSRFRQMADALITADAALNGGANAAAINQAMKLQGLPRTGMAASSVGLASNTPFVCETAHNYADFEYKECRFTQPGAARLRVRFSSFDTESGFDWAYVSDADYREVEALSGQPFGAGSGFSAAVTGDTIVVRFKADQSLGRFGFRIDLVEYVAGAAASPSGRVPETLAQGTPLRLVRAGAQVMLTWGVSCAAGDTDYEVYEGTLGSPASAAQVACSTGGLTSHTYTPAAGNRFFLVVSRNATREGSYGRLRTGAERPPAAAACVPQDILSPCP